MVNIRDYSRVSLTAMFPNGNGMTIEMSLTQGNDPAERQYIIELFQVFDAAATEWLKKQKEVPGGTISNT